MRECTLDDLGRAYDAGATVVDVREPGEYAGGHVPGAILIPLAQVGARFSEVPRTGPVYVICASGNRSKAATTVLENAGFEAYSVAGGTGGWVQLGRPVVTGMSPR
ncbi:MAG: rhodanese-like domain-containing protein [Actinobacteria bacterium]|nr:rhodanese-like domain-containing protein [Actinomycetota bacterium]